MTFSKKDMVADQIMASAQATDWAGTVRRCRAALRKNRLHPVANRMLGFALYKLGDVDNAFEVYKKAAATLPKDAELLINYANLLIERACHFEAVPLLDRVCELQPKEAIGWLKLSQACYQTQQHEKGFKAAERGTELAQNVWDKTSALTQKAIHRRELGQVHEAVLDCEAAIAIKPDEPSNYTNRLLFMLGDPQTLDIDLANAAREFGTQFETPLKPLWPDYAEHERGPWRRLKIGFLSADFRNHAAMYWMEGLLVQLDRRQFEVYAFYLYPKNDWVTERVERHVEHFIQVGHLSAPEQATAIRDQSIDILVDLSGHTGHHGLLAVARKPAPVQANWLGFVSTTGLTAIDYKVTSDLIDPPGSDYLYTEKLCRLPVGGCYRPMIRNPLWRYQPRYLVRPTPALSNGFITFGTSNNLGKLTDEVLSVWGRLLTEVPHSRLLIEGKNFDHPEFEASYRARCCSLGIDSSRLELLPLNPANQYLTYHRIDIGLDPFPLTGSTTTFDTLWMGVPLVSMVGRFAQERLSLQVLTSLERTEWLANNTDEYVDIAKSLAADIDKLNTLRLGLRDELEQSVNMRENYFCHYFGEALRAMWLQWLAQDEHPDDPDKQATLIESWLPDMPTEWSSPPSAGVGIAPGQRIRLDEAHQRLQELVDNAKQVKMQARAPSDQISHKSWVAVTKFAEIVLNAVPNDPVALACLAEVEHAHGHTEFAVTYLQHAAKSMHTH